MTSKTCLLILSTLLLLLLQSRSGAQTAAEGVVRSAQDSSAIAGATVLLQVENAGKSSKSGTLTKADGSFKIVLNVGGSYHLSVSMVGYRKFGEELLLKDGETRKVDVYLTPSPFQTQQVIVTASKRRQLLVDAPASVSIIGAKSIERRNVISLDDALRYVPGVNVIQDQVDIRGSSGYARGIGSRVLLLVNGIPLLAGDTGEAVWESIPVSDIDHVEVVKGAGSALYGSNALGGVIDVITKDDVNVNTTEVKLYGGTYEQPKYSTWQWSNRARYFQGVSIAHSQPIGIGDFGATVSLSYKRDDGYIENDDFRRINLFAESEGNLGKGQKLNLFGDLFDQHSGNFLYWENLDHALQPSVSTLGQWVNSTRANVAGIYTDIMNDKFMLTARASYYYNHWYDNFGQTPTGIGDSSTSNLGFLELQGTWTLDPETVVILGGDEELDFIKSNLFTSRQSNSGAFYLQVERRFGKLHTTIGGRLDYEKIESRSSFLRLNPKLGLVYDIGAQAAVRASIGTGFRAPSLGETYASTETGGVLIKPNPSLLPESSLSEEVGIRFPIAWYGLIDAAIFQNDFWNMIEPEIDPSTGLISFQNVTRARIQGYEVDASSDLGTSFLTLRASYTYVYPVDLTTHEILKYRSRKLFYVSADFAKWIYRASADFRYMSEFENYDKQLVQLGIVQDGNRRVPAYITDIRAGVDLTPIGLPLFVSFIVNNAFEYYYVEMIGNVAPIRNYSIMVSTEF